MNEVWSRPPAIVVFTRGALSRESGFAPFDLALLGPELALEDIVTEDGFARDPLGVNEFYNARRRELLAAQPNAAHDALAAFDTVRPHEMLIVTRNIDDLHERAGAQAVIHTHGELLKARCTICTHVSQRLDDVLPETICPVCGNAGHLRPHIVWVGEDPLGVAGVYEALAHCRLFLAIGVPGDGELARSFLDSARRAGAHAVEFGIRSAAPFDEHILGPLAETVPAYIKRLLADPA